MRASICIGALVFAVNSNSIFRTNTGVYEHKKSGTLSEKEKNSTLAAPRRIELLFPG